VRSIAYGAASRRRLRMIFARIRSDSSLRNIFHASKRRLLSRCVMLTNGYNMARLHKREQSAWTDRCFRLTVAPGMLCNYSRRPCARRALLLSINLSPSRFDAFANCLINCALITRCRDVGNISFAQRMFLLHLRDTNAGTNVKALSAVIMVLLQLQSRRSEFSLII